MTIIEKLGITPGQWEVSGAHEHYVFKGAMIIAECSTNNINKRYIPENTKLIATAPEMLEALIEIMTDNFDAHVVTKLDININFKLRGLFQKATGKSWEEIKQLL